ncbi:hypothetical protein C943_00061 [Mariniradius saccharolyticus AK6]|uniref:Uncharacterized protein n=1 Tax=Mariniradius saccharolyticus AK6 TaxID=1239962 RepID=M7XLD3_9BACT|nr:hypothetical protein C943_00061 [Mariniradius saccharolyticus AK6]
MLIFDTQHYQKNEGTWKNQFPNACEKSIVFNKKKSQLEGGFIS